MGEILPPRHISNMSEMIRQAIRAGKWKNKDIIAWVAENKDGMDLTTKSGIICQVKRRDFNSTPPDGIADNRPRIAAKINPTGKLPPEMFNQMNQWYRLYGKEACARMWKHIEEHNIIF